MSKLHDNSLALVNARCYLKKKCSETDCHVVASILDIQTVDFEEKYLELPIPKGRIKDN
jgi:hypothetical protein